MTYDFQERLLHVGQRLRKVNRFNMVYIAGGREYPVIASPILITPDELSPGISSAVRVERQDFAIDRAELADAYPPVEGHKLRDTTTGEEYLVKPKNVDDPPYGHTTSKRLRVIVHTVRSKKGLKT